MAPISRGRQTSGLKGLPKSSSISLGIMSPKWGGPLLPNGRERWTEGVVRQAHSMALEGRGAGPGR